MRPPTYPNRSQYCEEYPRQRQRRQQQQQRQLHTFFTSSQFSTDGENSLCQNETDTDNENQDGNQGDEHKSIFDKKPVAPSQAPRSSLPSSTRVGGLCGAMESMEPYPWTRHLANIMTHWFCRKDTAGTTGTPFPTSAANPTATSSKRKSVARVPLRHMKMEVLHESSTQEWANSNGTTSHDHNHRNHRNHRNTAVPRDGYSTASSSDSEDELGETREENRRWRRGF